MNPLDQFADQPYLNLETLRRNGQAVQTPVWFVQDGGTLYVRTVAESGKVKRLRNNPHVRIAACGADGTLLGSWVPSEVREVQNDPAVEAKVDQMLDVKYGEIKREFARQAAEAGRIYTILEIKLSEQETS